MPRDMPALATERLVIRPFTLGDLDDVHRILDVELHDASTGTEGAMRREDRSSWLTWIVLGYEQLSKLHQPPHGERAITLKDTGQLIGASGYVPSLDAFDQIPSLRPAGAPPTRRCSAELGLFWAVSPAHQRRGYAAEAARALVDYAFQELRVTRVIATTTRDNAASIGVMRRLGMRIEDNPYPDPPWLQIVGSLDHAARRSPP